MASKLSLPSLVILLSWFGYIDTCKLSCLITYKIKYPACKSPNPFSPWRSQGIYWSIERPADHSVFHIHIQSRCLPYPKLATIPNGVKIACIGILSPVVWKHWTKIIFPQSLKSFPSKWNGPNGLVVEWKNLLERKSSIESSSWGLAEKRIPCIGTQKCGSPPGRIFRFEVKYPANSPLSINSGVVIAGKMAIVKYVGGWERKR
jgi:hypothetical protein